METIEISKAIIAVMNDINWVAKSMTVWKGANSYKWVADKEVKQAIRESMIKNWLAILPIWIIPKIQIDRWEEDDTYNKQPPYPKKTKQSVFTEVETKYILIHTSWESIELAWYWQWVDTQDKWAGKATTYALKNTLLNMFLIPTGVDTDDTHSEDLPIPKKTKTEDKKPSISYDGWCPACWVICNNIKTWTTKTWKPYEMWNCECWEKFFINRKS